MTEREPTRLEDIVTNLIERITGEIGEEQLDVHEVANARTVNPAIGNWQLTYQELHIVRFVLSEALKTLDE